MSDHGVDKRKAMHMNARDEIVELMLANRAQTSTRETTGRAMAEVAADLLIARIVHEKLDDLARSVHGLSTPEK